jgi:hypothetical protein
VDTGRTRTYRGVVTSPGDPQRPHDAGRAGPEQGRPGQDHPFRPFGPTPYDDPAADPNGSNAPPYVYNPYGNVSYPASYPTHPAGLGPDDAALPAHRPRSVTMGLVLAVISTLPYLLVGFLAVAAAGAVEAAVPPEQLAQLQQVGVDLEQVVRSTGIVLLVVALLFVLLAVLAWTGRRWARALLAAMTAGFVLMVFVSVAAASAQGVAMDAGSLVVIAGPVLLAAVAVALMFGSAARAWFSAPRAPHR